MYRITSACTGCGVCAAECPFEAIQETNGRLYAIDTDTCTDCGRCEEVCPEEAVTYEDVPGSQIADYPAAQVAS